MGNGAAGVGDCAGVTGGIGRLVRRFPCHEAAIVNLARRDADFRELCRGYQECAEALARWSASDVADLARVREYRRLLAALEGEIEAALARVA